MCLLVLVLVLGEEGRKARSSELNLRFEIKDLFLVGGVFFFNSLPRKWVLFHFEPR